MSYTQFAYSDLTFEQDQLKPQDTLKAKIKITNAGPVDGDEVVQLYLSDQVASLTRPVKELKAFKRIHLKAKQSRWLEFSVPVAQLGFYSEQMVYQSGARQNDHPNWQLVGGYTPAKELLIQGDGPVAVTKQFFSSVRSYKH